MKKFLTSFVAASLLVFAGHAADVSIKLSDVHLCCPSCVKGVSKAVEKVKGVTATADQDEGTVTLVAADKATLQKAADAVVEAGYFGKSTDSSIKLASSTGAKDQKVQSLKIAGVHLCCGKCVKAVGSALESVAGVKANTATKGATSFEVTGDFNEKDVFLALQKAGLSGTVGK